MEGEVAEDDVGGDVLVGGESAAQGAQLLEEGLIGVGEGGGVGGAFYSGGDPRRLRGLRRGGGAGLGDLEALFAFEDKHAGGGEVGGAVFVGGEGELVLADERVGERAPVGLGLVLADAVDAELVVALVDDFLGHGAAEDVDDVAEAEALSGAGDRREEFLGVLGGVV